MTSSLPVYNYDTTFVLILSNNDLRQTREGHTDLNIRLRTNQS